MPTIVLAALTVVAAVATLDLTLNLNLFGLISESRVGAPYTVNGGWSLALSELYVGAVRLGYPFLVGMMLSRTKRLVRMKGGFVWTALLVAALLLMPAFEGGGNGHGQSLWDTCCTLRKEPLTLQTPRASSAHATAGLHST